MSDSFLCVNSINKSYKQNRILNNLSFSLEEGEHMIIQGKSGCGKTTLLRCIARLERIDSGNIIFRNKVVSNSTLIKNLHTSKNLDIAMVFQNLYLWSHMTVLDNIMIPLWLRNGRNKKTAKELALRKLIELDIEEKANNYPSQLSGGQKQRVALARALVHSPRLLLLDEITANLDTETANRVMKVIEQITDPSMSLIMITHNPIKSEIWNSKLEFSDGHWKKMNIH